MLIQFFKSLITPKKTCIILSQSSIQNSHFIDYSFEFQFFTEIHEIFQNHNVYLFDEEENHMRVIKQNLNRILIVSQNPNSMIQPH